MKKFKAIVTETHKYEIEIDETVYTEEEIKEWSKHFFNAIDLKDIVSHLVRLKQNYEDGEFIEGFGIPLDRGKPHYLAVYNGGINYDINISNSTSDVEIDVEEI